MKFLALYSIELYLIKIGIFIWRKLRISGILLFFGSMTFKGNPAAAHVNLDKKNDYKITQDHFAIWLNHWNQTINANYQSEKAEDMKMRASEGSSS